MTQTGPQRATPHLFPAPDPRVFALSLILSAGLYHCAPSQGHQRWGTVSSSATTSGICCCGLGASIPWLFNESFSFSSQPLKLPTPQSVRAGLDGVGKSPVCGLLQALTFLTRNEILW